MFKTNSNSNSNSNSKNNHTVPPLSVSLPSPTRLKLETEPKPELEPVLKPSSPVSIVPLERYYSPLTSPLPATPPLPPPSPQHQLLQLTRRDEIPPETAAVNGGGERKGKGLRFVVRRSKKEDNVNKVGFGIRVFQIVFSVISFSLMASDKTQGWSGDSFYRYKEYRFCLTVAIFGFVYSAFQAYDLGSYIATGKHVITHRFRNHFDFLMDQILAYLLISAASASASRIDDWQKNWGKDEFTQKASASISMAFLAFVCFALSSLISGYNLCTPDLY